MSDSAPYLRSEEVTGMLPVCGRTLSNWRKKNILPYYKVGRAVFYKRADIESALERFRIAGIGEITPRQPRKRHATRITQ